MPLKHSDLWRAIDLLARKHKLSVSGLARKARLSPTIFNLSKRESAARKRWPSTESLSAILQATNTSFDQFMALAVPEKAVQRTTLPLLGYAQAGREGFFDDAGYPTGSGWDEITFPGLADPNAFILEVSGASMQPLYREGDRLVLSPAEKLRRGDRVVVRTVKGEVLVKQFERATGQKIELLSLNPDFAPTVFAPHEIEWMYRIVWASQ